MRLVIGQDLPISASSSGSLSGTTSTFAKHANVEVSIMVDLTGSMGQSVGGSTKIAAH